MTNSRMISRLIENRLDNTPRLFDDNYLLELTRTLTVDSFAQIAEELAANHKCGYFLCPNDLSSEILNVKQKYKIFRNQIFDISQRKYFCSDECYKIFRSLLDQFDELPNPKLHLVFPRLSGKDNIKEEIKTGDKVHLTSADEIAALLKKLTIDSAQRFNPQQDRALIEEISSYETEIRSESDRDESETSDQEDDTKYEYHFRKAENCPKSSSMEERLNAIRQKYFDKSRGHLIPKRRIISIVDAKSETSTRLQNISRTRITENVDLPRLIQCLNEWFEDCTENVFLLTDSGQSTSSDPIVDDQGCSRKKMEDDFRKKVDHFFRGDFIKLSENHTSDSSNNSKTAVLPLIDSEDQMQQRRKIVLNQLKKRLADACQVLEVKQDRAWTILRAVVSKLKLRATNVVLNLNEWMVVCVVLLFASKYHNNELLKEEVREISSNIGLDLSFVANLFEKAKQ